MRVHYKFVCLSHSLAPPPPPQHQLSLRCKETKGTAVENLIEHLNCI